ncbi:capsular polysaccharide export protein, LipB/KpsS family [Cohaesibacter marisflavi]|uniref:capsular polysaccharide export protein, LipB/KpsS family n=1 Tax=Cohaesibacter marisflavi TaxID=655353 RepID=UPI0029C63164|nr:beta-3-deoxy-D-manno-oct-2-ulosonic acid transferase [Cohaesibacter marisflavi]
MANQTRDWMQRPAVIYGVGFWNRKSMAGMLAPLPGKPRFIRSFKRALKAAKASNASLFAWATRLSPEQRAACNAEGVAIVNVEDGFIRSVGLGAAFTPAASLIMDASGIYYDPSHPSDLETMLEQDTVSAEERLRGQTFRQKVVDLGVSKYNLGNKASFNHSKNGRPPTDALRILVPGQVSDDASIQKSRSDSLALTSGENPNLLLLKWVRSHHPDAHITFKPHPDVTNGLRDGNLSDAQMLAYADAIELDTDIIQLIEQCDSLHTISSLSGFEALLRNKHVVVHGLPFYAGWGISEDKTSCLRRTTKRSLDELVYLAMIKYPHYVSPLTFQYCEAEETVDQLSRLRNNKAGSAKDGIMLQIARLAFRLGL